MILKLMSEVIRILLLQESLVRLWDMLQMNQQQLGI